jgi:hypothetical protein
MCYLGCDHCICSVTAALLPRHTSNDAAAACISAAGAVVPSFSAYPLASVTAVGELLRTCCAVGFTTAVLG